MTHFPMILWDTCGKNEFEIDFFVVQVVAENMLYIITYRYESITSLVHKSDFMQCIVRRWIDIIIGQFHAYK